MAARGLVAILLIGGFIAGLFIVWSNGTQQGIQIIPADVRVSTLAPGDLTLCQRAWVGTGGLSVRPGSILGGHLLFPLM